MPETIRIRPSHDAVLPEDVTDPLLWRLAYDVAAAHRPDATGHCPSLLCAGQSAPCPPMVLARRAMRQARAGEPATTAHTSVPRAGDQRRAAA